MSTKAEQEAQEKAIAIPLSKWVLGCQANMRTILYASLPVSYWAEDGQNKKSVEVELVGVQNTPDLPDGLYTTDLPSDVDEKYRQPYVVASYFMNQAGKDVIYLPLFVNYIYPAPSAHERIGARQELKEYKENNLDKKELVEAIEMLLALGSSKPVVADAAAVTA